MVSKYFSFWNMDRKLFDRPGIWRPKIGCVSPGHIADAKNDLAGGYRRFERYQKLPEKASKLYWRQERIKGRGT